MNQYNISPISEEQELEIIDLFLNSKMSLMDIAQKYDRHHRDFVYRILKKYNISKNRRHISNKFSEQEVQEIIDAYQKENISCAQLAKRYNVSESTIDRIIKSNNIEVRRHWSHTFDENYFDNIDTPNKAYLLGFIYADGCVEKNNVVSIVVHKKDIEVLEMFKKELKATNNINETKTKPHVRINFCSKHMCDILIYMGCGRNKTNSLVFPDISEQYKYDFIRGFMDGDGCISIKNRGSKKYISLSFTGTFEMLDALKLSFHIDNPITFYRNSYALHIGKKDDVMRILSNIYHNAELYMTRKFNKYKEYIEWMELANE